MSALCSRRVQTIIAAQISGRIENARTRVLVVDNHELVRRGLAALVNAEPDMVSCGEVPCSEAAIEAVRQSRPDVVVIDVSLARGAGLELIQRIRKCDASIRIVALAMNDKPELVARVIHAGAAAFVMKTGLAARVVEAIRRNQIDRRGETPRVEEGAANRPAGSRSERCLDPVEREVAELIGRGVATQAIAVRLGMSVAMVEAYRRRIRSKLNFPTATQFVQFCVRWAERASETAQHE